MRNFIYWIADHAPAGVRTLARWIADRIFAVWDDLSHVFRLIVPTWDPLYWALKHFRNWVRNALTEVYQTLWWIMFVRVPRHIEAYIGPVYGWIADRVRVVLDIAARNLSALGSTVWDWVQAVRHSLDSALHWVSDRLGELWHEVHAIEDRVRTLLTHPEVLASWLFDPMWRMFWRYLDSRAEAIGQAAWSIRERIILSTVDRLERLLARFL